MSSERFFQPHCCICGRFVSFRDDGYVPCADNWASEPPVAKFVCQRCAVIEKGKIIAAGKMPDRWQHSEYELDAAEALGLEYDGRNNCWTKKGVME